MSAEEPPDGGGGTPPETELMECSQNSVDGRIRPEIRKRPRESEILVDAKRNKPPSNSIQSVYTKPGFESDSKFLYSDSDRAPFTVFISREETDPRQGLTLNSLKFAQFIHSKGFKGVVQGSVKSLGRNRMSIDFATFIDANNFVSNPILSDYKYMASIPRFHVTRMGVVRDIPTDWTLEELVNGLETPHNCGDVIRARRLNFKNKKEDIVTWSPSSTVVLTFSGQVLPEKVFCYNASLPVSFYHLPTIQCRNCLRFGHISSQCRSNSRCYRCAQPHPGDSCKVPDSQVTCILCSGGSHKATDDKCPEHSRQKSIKMVMSQENLSYREASVRFPHPKKLYSNVAEGPSQTKPSQASPFESLHLSPPLTTPSSSPYSSPNKTSYSKTVYRSPKPRPELGKSYDTQSHRSMVYTPNSSQPNGCAFNSPYVETTPLPTPNDNLIELLTCSLINILSKFSDSIPDNVVILVEQLLKSWTRQNAGKNSSVEL